MFPLNFNKVLVVRYDVADIAQQRVWGEGKVLPVDCLDDVLARHTHFVYIVFLWILINNIVLVHTAD